MIPDVSPSDALGLTMAPADSGRVAGVGSMPSSIAVPGLASPVKVKIAATRDEFEQASRLLPCQYQARGYEEPGPKLFRFPPYHALPETTTFVAKCGDRVIATVSQVPDTTLLGLP